MRHACRTFAIPCVIAASALGLAMAISCGTPNPLSQSGDFLAPSGLAVGSARDRDLLFIASAGGDELRALTICSQPSSNPDGGPATSADGGVLPADTCPSQEDFQFLPGPIRVFPASIAVNDRPVRLASARLLGPDGGNTGMLLIGGADTRLAVLDVANVVDVEQGVVPALKQLRYVDLITSPPVDVIARNAPSPVQPDVEVGAAVVHGYALTQAAQGVPAAIIALQISADPISPVVKMGRCNLRVPGADGGLSAVVGTRLALVPRSGQLPPSGVLADDARFDNFLYVADGTPAGVAGGIGDGALELDTTQPALNVGADPLDANPQAVAPDCVVLRRLAATDPVSLVPLPLRSLALSPRYIGPRPPLADGGTGAFVDGGSTWPDGGTTLTAPRVYDPGAFLLGATVDGRVVLLRGDVGGQAPLPPLIYAPGDGTAGQPGFPRMEPLRVNGLARDVNFLKPPSATKCSPLADPSFSCNFVQVGNGAQYTAVQFGLVGMATSSDGSTNFIDVDDRRFISDLRDLGASTGSQPMFTAVNPLQPLQPNGAVPQLSFPPPQLDPATGAQVPGGICCIAVPGAPINGGNLTAGVTRNGLWTVEWHAAIPGLERRAGTLSGINPDGTLHIDFPAVTPSTAFPSWTNPPPPPAGSLPTPALLDPKGGDVVAVQVFAKPDGSGVCPALANENQLPLQREYSIRTLTSSTSTGAPPMTTDSIDVTNGGLAIDPSCLPVGVTVEFRTAAGFGKAAWLVFEAGRPRGRAVNGVLFNALETRFDYPLAYQLTDPFGTPPGQPTAAFYPTADKDVAVAFTVVGPEPVTPKSYFTFQLSSGQQPTHVSDTNQGSAFAGTVIVYTSPKDTNLVFTAVTGGNSVLQADPGLLDVFNGLIVYR